MAAYDNVLLPRAPNAPNYAAPLLDFSPIAEIPDAYFKGTQQARTRAQQTAFEKGLPTDQNGQIDWNAVTQKMIQLGGTEAVPEFLKLQLQQQALRGGGPVGEGGDTNAPPASTPGSAPAVQRTPVQVPAHGVPSGGPAPGSDSGSAEGGQSVMDVIEANGVPAEKAGYVADVISKRLNIDPNKPITDRSTLANVNRQVMAAKAQQGQQTAQAETPAASGGQTPIVPRPVQTETIGPAPSPPGLGLADARELRAKATQNLDAARRYAAAGFAPAAKAFEDQAAAQNRKADAIEQAALENSKRTNEQKNAASSGFQSPYEFHGATELQKTEAENQRLTNEQKNAAASAAGGPMTPRELKSAEESDKADVELWNKRYPGLQALGESSINGIEKAKLMKSLTLQPGFYSGPLHEHVQTYQQFKSVFGTNPSSALPAEAFHKVVNDMLIEQVKALGQSGVGRVLQTEVNTMRAGIASMGITAQSNRALAEIVSRIYAQQAAIADIARSVKAPPGQLNRTLDTAVTKYLQAHPLFKPDELQHPQLLGAPDAPPASAKWSPPQARAWAKSVGLKPGDPIRINGQIAAVP